MHTYLNPEALPDPQTLANVAQALAGVLEDLRGLSVPLSLSERQSRRKLGPRRLAYAQQAERIARHYERLMPRQFEAQKFTNIMEFRNAVADLHAQVKEAAELLDDTLMAAGIDAMTYTKLVHDGIRTANAYDAAAETALKELDEFNTRSSGDER